MRSILFSLLMLLSTVLFGGAMDAFVFETPEQEAMFNKLSGELRCLVCQNQSISDSNAGLAQDLRKEIHGMITEGQSEEEIVTFMVERYGDYVLYRPPFKPITWMLWLGPIIAFIIGLIYVVRFIRSQKIKVEVGELSADESERLRNLQSDAGKEEGK
jgi:cytochrome c-type biogenesis protein CcmH